MTLIRSTLACLVSLALLVASLAFIEHRALAAPSNKTPGAAASATKPAVSVAPEPAAAEPADEAVAPDSPRASITEYLQLCSEGNYAEAAHFLAVTPKQGPRAAELARRLKAVLDNWISLDPETLSPLSVGDLSERLPDGMEQIGEIPGAKGKLEPLRLTRRVFPGAHARWVFSHSTVDRIDGWYERLAQRWFLEHLPPYLLQVGWHDLLIWQWFALPIMFLGGWFAGYVLSRLTRITVYKIAKRTSAKWLKELVVRSGGPLTLTWSALAVHLLLPWLGLYRPAEAFIDGIVRGGFLIVFFWVLSRLIDVWGNLITSSAWAQDHTASHSLVPLVVRVGKIAVLIVAVITLVSAFGYPAASLVAGLGVGGLALALAAQKTVENLFGAVSIGADQPFRVGDFVKLEDVLGTVEAIGLRSTRIRTLDRTVVSIPNGKLSEMRVECYAPRDRLRLYCNLRLVYGTTAEQMRRVISDLEQVLKAHPKIWPDNVSVRFKELAAASLNIEVMAWFQTSDFAEFQLIRQEILLSFMDVVQKAGSDFAFPTQTVHVIQEPAPK